MNKRGMTANEVVVAVVAIVVLVVVLYFVGPIFLKIIIPIIRGTNINGSVQLTTGPEIVRYRLLTGEVQWYDSTTWQNFPADQVVLGKKFIVKSDIKNTFSKYYTETNVIGQQVSTPSGNLLITGLSASPVTYGKLTFANYIILDNNRYYFTADNQLYQRTAEPTQVQFGTSVQDALGAITLKGFSTSEDLTGPYSRSTPVMQRFFRDLDGVKLPRYLNDAGDDASPDLTNPLPIVSFHCFMSDSSLASGLESDKIMTAFFRWIIRSETLTYPRGVPCQAIWNGKAIALSDFVVRFRIQEKSVLGYKITDVEDGPYTKPEYDAPYTLLGASNPIAQAVSKKLTPLFNLQFKKPLSFPYQELTSEGKPTGVTRTVSVCIKKIDGLDLVADLSLPATTCS